VGAGVAAGGAAGAVVAQRIVTSSSAPGTEAEPAGAQKAVGADAGDGADADARTGADAPTGTNAEAAKTGTDADTDADADADVDTDADTDAEADPKADDTTRPRTNAESETGTDAKTHDIPAAEAVVDPPAAPDREVLSGYLTEQTVKVALGARDKEAAIREMAELIARTGKVADVDELVATALRREEQGTTGLGEEIAIPHAKTDAVSAPVVGFARSAEGVEWGSLDGTKARLIFMISVPEAAAGDEHLRILALLSRRLMDAGFRERLIAAPDERAVLEVLSEIG
jgi:PTS system fructose-specific IIC component